MSDEQEQLYIDENQENWLNDYINDPEVLAVMPNITEMQPPDAWEVMRQDYLSKGYDDIGEFSFKGGKNTATTDFAKAEKEEKETDRSPGALSHAWNLMKKAGSDMMNQTSTNIQGVLEGDTDVLKDIGIDAVTGGMATSFKGSDWISKNILGKTQHETDRDRWSTSPLQAVKWVAEKSADFEEYSGLEKVQKGAWNKAAEYVPFIEKTDHGVFGQMDRIAGDAYNKSNAGLLYDIFEGKQKYDVGDYEPGAIGGALSFGLQMGLDPYSIMSIVSGGQLGQLLSQTKLAGKVVEPALGKIVLPAIDKALRTGSSIIGKTQAAQINSTLHKAYAAIGAKQIIQGGADWGVFSGVQGYISQLHADKKEFGEVNHWNALKTGLHEGGKGMATGAALRGLMTPLEINHTKRMISKYGLAGTGNKKFSKMTDAEKNMYKAMNIKPRVKKGKLGTFMQASGDVATGPVGQIGLEALGLSTLHTAQGVMSGDIPAEHMYDDFWHHLGQNMIIVGMMKRKGLQAQLKGNSYEYSMNTLLKHLKDVEASKQARNQSAKNVIKSLEGEGDGFGREVSIKYAQEIVAGFDSANLKTNTSTGKQITWTQNKIKKMKEITQSLSQHPNERIADIFKRVNEFVESQKGAKKKYNLKEKEKFLGKEDFKIYQQAMWWLKNQGKVAAMESYLIKTYGFKEGKGEPTKGKVFGGDKAEKFFEMIEQQEKRKLSDVEKANLQLVLETNMENILNNNTKINEALTHVNRKQKATDTIQQKEIKLENLEEGRETRRLELQDLGDTSLMTRFATTVLKDLGIDFNKVKKPMDYLVENYPHYFKKNKKGEFSIIKKQRKTIEDEILFSKEESADIASRDNTLVKANQTLMDDIGKLFKRNKKGAIEFGAKEDAKGSPQKRLIQRMYNENSSEYLFRDRDGNAINISTGFKNILYSYGKNLSLANHKRIESIVNLLHRFGRKDFSELKKSHVTKVIDDMLAKKAPGAAKILMESIGTLHSHTQRFGSDFLPSQSLADIKKGNWSRVNKMLTDKAKDRKKVISENWDWQPPSERKHYNTPLDPKKIINKMYYTAKDFVKENIFNKGGVAEWKGKGLISDVAHIIMRLKGEEGSGIRTQEINKIRPADVGYDKSIDTYYIDLNFAGKKTAEGQRIIAISKPVYNRLLKHIETVHGKEALNPNHPKYLQGIFSKGVTSKITKAIMDVTGVREKIIEGGKKKGWIEEPLKSDLDFYRKPYEGYIEALNEYLRVPVSFINYWRGAKGYTKEDAMQAGREAYGTSFSEAKMLQLNKYIMERIIGTGEFGGKKYKNQKTWADAVHKKVFGQKKEIGKPSFILDKATEGGTKSLNIQGNKPSSSKVFKAVVDKIINRTGMENLKKWVEYKDGKNRDWAAQAIGKKIQVALGNASIKDLFHEMGEKALTFYQKIGGKTYEQFNSGIKQLRDWALKNDYDNFMEQYVEKYKQHWARRGRKLSQEDAINLGAKEYFMDKIADWYNDRMFNKDLNQRMNQWAKLTWSKAMVSIFGSTNPKHLQRILGEKVFKGEFELYKETPGKSKFSLGKETNPEVLAPKLTRFLNEQLKKAGYTPKSIAGVNNPKSKSMGRKLFEEMAFLAGIAEPSKFVMSKDTPLVNLNKMSVFLAELQPQTLINAKNKISRLRTMHQVNLQRKQTVKGKNPVTTEMEADVLRLIGVSSGRIVDANTKQLKKLLVYYWNINHKKDIRHADSMVAAAQEYFGVDIDKIDQTSYTQAKHALSMTVLPQLENLRRLGANDLADRLIDHTVQELRYVGHHTTFENSFNNILSGTKYSGNKVVKRTPLDIVGEWFFLFDKKFWMDKDAQMHLDIADGKQRGFFAKKGLGAKWDYLKKQKGQIKKLKGAREFIYNAFTPESIKKVESNTKGAKFEPNLKTKEGQAVAEYLKFQEFFKSTLEDIIVSQKGEAGLKAWKESGAVKWIEDNIYFSRMLSSEFKRIKKGSDTLKKLEVQSNLLAEDMARNEIAEWYGNQREKVNQGKQVFIKPFKKQVEGKWYKVEAPEDVLPPELIGHYYKTAEGQLKNSLNAHQNLTPDRLVTPQLKNRKFYLGYMTKGGDLIYDTSYNSGVKRYTTSMSKLLANMEFFPEFADLKNYSDQGLRRKYKDAVRNAFEGNPELKKLKFIDNLISEQTGMRLRTSNFGKLTAAHQWVATVGAKFGLSFPTSGIKNLGQGVVGGVSAYDAINVMRSYSDAVIMNNNFYHKLLQGLQKAGLFKSVKTGKITKADYQRILETGATEIGMRHFTEGPFTQGLDKTVFRWGFMRPSENLNRFAMVLAGWADQKNLIETYSNKYQLQGARDKAYKRLNKFYELTDADIKLVSRYGFDGLDAIKNDLSLNTPQLKAQTTRRYNLIKQKMNSMAHVKTQGASLDLFMPAFMASPDVRPALLFKRMAYAATINTKNNMKQAKNEGGWIHLMKKMTQYTAASGMQGMMMMGIYRDLLGKVFPGEKDDGWRPWVRNLLWAGEFSGIPSGFGSPYFMRDGTLKSFVESSLDIVAPFTMNIMYSLYNLAMAASAGHLTPYQTADKMLRQSFQAYNAAMSMKERGLLADDKFYQNKVRSDNVWKDYLIERGHKVSLANYETNERSKFYLNLRTNFYHNKDNPVESAKDVITLLHAMQDHYLTEGYVKVNGEQGFLNNPEEAMKKAVKQMKTYLTRLNPNRFSKSRLTTEGKKKEALDFIGYLTDTEDIKDLASAKLQGKGKEIFDMMIDSEELYQKRYMALMKAMPYVLRKTDNNHIAKIW